MTKHDKNEKTGESEMKKKVLSLMLAGAMVLSMAACGSQNTDQGAANDTSAKAEQSDSSEAAKENSDSEELESTQITVFAAASLENAFKRVIKKYNETQPNVQSYRVMTVQEHCLHRLRKVQLVMYSSLQPRSRWIRYRTMISW